MTEEEYINKGNEPEVERLADYAHDAWSGWMTYMCSKFEGVTKQDDYYLVKVPAESYERWLRQMNTPYESLSDKEKESDKEQADKILKLLSSK